MLVALSCLGQDIIDNMITYNYTIEEGLPSNQVLCSMQDSKGNIWFGTGGGGVARFNGAKFDVFNIENGMLDNEVFSIYEDYKGRIWFGTYSLNISYFENGKIHPYQYNTTLTQHIGSSSLLKNLYVDKNDHLFISFHAHLLVEITNQGKLITKNNKQYFDLISFDSDDNKLLFSCHTNLKKIQNT